MLVVDFWILLCGCEIRGVEKSVGAGAERENGYGFGNRDSVLGGVRCALVLLVEVAAV